jgi:flagellar biosynthesis protein FliQ
MDILIGHMGHGIGLILLLSLPAVLLAAGIGLVVGILQAVTQVQEQTIAAAPKITFVFLLIIFGGPFMIESLKDFMVESTHLALEVIPKDELMILPPKPRMAYGEENARLDFFKEKKRAPSQSKVKAMMNSPSKASGFVESAGAIVDNSSKPRPKPGVGEQVYMQRRAAGKLPKPPDKR